MPAGFQLLCHLRNILNPNPFINIINFVNPIISPLYLSTSLTCQLRQLISSKTTGMS